MFYLTNDPFCIKYNAASRVGLRPSPTCQTGQGGSRSVGCGLIGNETGSQKRQSLLLTTGARPVPKSRSRHKVRGDVGSSLGFRPHAIIVTDRSVPSPIFVAALIGVEKILRIDFDTSLPEATFVQQALAKILKQTIAFGRPIGVTVSYAPDRAVRYDLKGDPLETFTEAIRCAKAYLTIPPSKKGHICADWKSSWIAVITIAKI
jgi:hypothetical protein